MGLLIQKVADRMGEKRGAGQDIFCCLWGWYHAEGQIKVIRKGKSGEDVIGPLLSLRDTINGE
jgi:hypothetical protein